MSAMNAGPTLERLGQQIGGLTVELAIALGRAETAEAEVERLREQLGDGDGDGQKEDAGPGERPDRAFG